ncbi:MAG: hypothetical protein IPL49_11460 [Saprospirales bacterium]|nr:hypothetical protein [Saprospirales bacterium]
MKINPHLLRQQPFYKGFLLQAAGRIKQLALTEESATEKFNSLKGYQRRLATQYSQPIADRDSALVTQLETKANELEKTSPAPWPVMAKPNARCGGRRCKQSFNQEKPQWNLSITNTTKRNDRQHYVCRAGTTFR